jgi:hypothetical protein
VEVDIELGLNPQTGLVTATFQTVDPRTGLPPDVLTGFLPPEDGTGRGTGFFTYTVGLKSDLPTGTPIRNVAVVLFDANDPITTDQVDPHDPTKGIDPAKQDLNTIDAGAPTSTVAALPALSPTSFNVSWSGTDDPGGSGVATYNIFVSDNGGPATAFRSDTPETTAVFTGVPGHTYAFYSVATDQVGNVQPTPAAPQASTMVQPAQATSLLAISGHGTFAATATLSATLAAGGTPLAGKTVSFALTIGGSTTTVGSATTDAQGIATLGGVSLAGVNAGTSTGAVGAGFAGDAGDLATGAAGDLTVSPAQASLALDGLAATYDGQPHPVRVTTNPPSLSGVSVTYTRDGVAVADPTQAGSYAVMATLNNPNAAAASVTGTLVINPATPTITWRDPADITAGTPLGPDQFDAAASVPGSFTYTPGAGGVLNAGQGQTLSATFTPSDRADYKAVTATAHINVTPTATAVPLVTVLGVQQQTHKLSKKKSTTLLVVSFSGALEKGPAETPGDYHLVALGKAKKSGKPAGKPVALTSAVYDPARNTVTLTPRGTVPNQTLQLTITAAGTLDAQGRPIDGNHDGQPGGNAVVVVSKQVVRIAVRGPR